LIPEQYDAGSVYAIANNGIATGYGSLSEMSDLPGSYPLVIEDVLQWGADGVTRPISGVDENGMSWKFSSLHDVRSDGGLILATGLAETTQGHSSRFSAVASVDGGLDWLLDDGEFRTDRIIYPNAMSDDGSIVAGNIDFLFGSKEAVVWTNNGRRQAFSTYLQLAGVDTEGWTFDDIVDVSGDGRTFVGYGSLEGSDDYLFYAVIPEPNTAFLLGFGLAVLSRRRISSKP
jgi:hypothetical protein